MNSPNATQPENYAQMEGAHILFPLLGVLFAITWGVVLMIGTTTGLPHRAAFASWGIFALFSLLFALRQFRFAMPFLVLSSVVAIYPLLHR